MAQDARVIHRKIDNTIFLNGLTAHTTDASFARNSLERSVADQDHIIEFLDLLEDSIGIGSYLRLRCSLSVLGIRVKH